MASTDDVTTDRCLSWLLHEHFERNVIFQVALAIGVGLPFGMGHEHRSAFVDPIYLSCYLLTIDKEMDGVARSEPVILGGDFSVCE